MSVYARPTAIVMDADLDASAELVKHLVSDGYNIVIPFYQNSAAANRIVSEIEAQGGTAVALFADLENHEHVAAVLRTANLAFGSCDLVLHPGGLETATASASANRNLESRPAMPAVIGGELRNRSQLTRNSL